MAAPRPIRVARPERRLAAREPRDEMLDQCGMSSRRSLQRRHEDREDVEAVEQILAEQAVLTRCRRSRCVAEISLMSTLTGRARADRIDLAVLHGAQQLDLHVERQVADLVEEQRAAMRLDELAGVLFGGAGEGALLVAEQDALDQIVAEWRRN